MESRKPDSWYGAGLVILATAFWSSSGLFIHLIDRVSNITPQGLAFWRDLLTFIFLFVGLKLVRPELLKVKRGDLPWLALMGAISMGAFHTLWNMSVLTNGVSVATVLQMNAPIFVAIVAWFLWKEPFTPYKLGAILLAIVGTILIARLDSLGSNQLTTLGLAIGLGSAVCYSSFTLLGKRLVGEYSSWTVLIYVFGFATLTLLPFQFGQPLPSPFPPAAVGALVGLVLVTNIFGYGIYTLGLRRLQASVAVILASSEVLFAAAMSYVVLGERLDGWQILGAGLVVGGVILVSWSSNRSQSLHPLQVVPGTASPRT